MIANITDRYDEAMRESMQAYWAFDSGTCLELTSFHI